jgi:hypothetical protein
MSADKTAKNILILEIYLIINRDISLNSSI